MTHPVRLTALLLLLGGATQPAAAEPITIGVEQGAVFDAIIDGFPMLALFDGVPDFPTGYNTLSIGLQIPVTEERGIGEFPVALLGGAGPDAVRSATLFFNIDDVIGTFGPGTSFRGTASQRILVHLFAGDGEVTVDDHVAIDRPGHEVDTRPLGRITDQTLAQSGPLTFEVDVTDDVRAALADSPPAVGVVWRTIDSPSATSLDNLGDGGSGPPGVGGSFLPYLVIDLETGASPTPTVTATPEPTATPTESPAATPTVTAAGGDPTPTATVDGTPCAGDCDGDGSVGVNELIAGVNMALGSALTPCAPMDGDGDGTVRVPELIQALNVALTGC